MNRVIIESPYRGDDYHELAENLRYAELCL